MNSNKYQKQNCSGQSREKGLKVLLTYSSFKHMDWAFQASSLIPCFMMTEKLLKQELKRPFQRHHCALISCVLRLPIEEYISPFQVPSVVYLCAPLQLPLHRTSIVTMLLLLTVYSHASYAPMKQSGIYPQNNCLDLYFYVSL